MIEKNINSDQPSDNENQSLKWTDTQPRTINDRFRLPTRPSLTQPQYTSEQRMLLQLYYKEWKPEGNYMVATITPKQGEGYTSGENKEDYQKLLSSLQSSELVNDNTPIHIVTANDSPSFEIRLSLEQFQQIRDYTTRIGLTRHTGWQKS